MGQLGRVLLMFGAVMLLVGAALLAAEKLGLGRLPGDLVVDRKGFRLYVPVATSVLLSLLLTLLANLFLRHR